MTTLKEIFTETFKWLEDLYDAGELNDAIQRARSVIKLTREEAKQWWGWAKTLTLCCAVISLLVFFSGAILGLWAKVGWPNALAGLLIAPVLFVLLIWWTPLVAIIAVIGEITHLRFKSIPSAAVAWAKWWLGVTCGILLWQVIASLAFTFIPYWNAPSRIPVMMLLALAMTLIGIRWGGFPKSRKIIKVLVVAMFVAQVAVCFFPATATALHSLLGKTDDSIATKVTTGAWVEETANYRIERRSGETWVVTFKTDNPIELPIGLGARFLISASEAINLQWPVMGKPNEWCSVPMNNEIINKVFANLVFRGEKGKTITIKLL